jgi:hypothetical protein
MTTENQTTLDNLKFQARLKLTITNLGFLGVTLAVAGVAAFSTLALVGVFA